MKEFLNQAVVFHAFYPFCLFKDLDPFISIFQDKSSKLCQFSSQCVEISVYEMHILFDCLHLSLIVMFGWFEHKVVWEV